MAIPTALPLIFTGLRISLGTAWMTLCAAEMLASNRGLGYMIQLNRTLARADLIVVAMLTIGVQEDEARNRAIYRHWGYLEPVLQEREDGVLVLYFAKHLSF